jgi:hypothetical protein
LETTARTHFEQPTDLKLRVEELEQKIRRAVQKLQ